MKLWLKFIEILGTEHKMLVSVVTASSKNLENMDELHLPEGFRPDFHPK